MGATLGLKDRSHKDILGTAAVARCPQDGNAVQRRSRVTAG